MLKAIKLLFVLGRDDLRVVRWRCVSVRQNYPLFEHPGFIVMWFSKSPRTTQRSSLPTNLPGKWWWTLKKPPILIRRNFTQNVTVKLLFLCEFGVLCERPLHIPRLTAHTDDRINLSQSSRCSQRPRLVIEQLLKKDSQFNQKRFYAKPKP